MTATDHLTAAPSPHDSSLSELVRIRAALSAGLSPIEALGAVPDGPLAAVAAAARMGRPLGELADAAHRPPARQRLARRTAAATTTAVPALEPHLQLLVRALAVAEQAGRGGAAGVEQALGAVRDARAGARLLRTRTAQARGTADLLGMIPLAAWVLLIGVDSGALSFYATTAGRVTGGLAMLGMLGGRWWSRRLVAGAAAAAAAADPLQPAVGRLDVRRGLVVGATVAAVLAVAGSVSAGVLVGAAVAAVVAAVARRTGRSLDVTGGGTAELVELLSLAMASGLATSAAVGLVAAVGPPAGRADLAAAHRRLEAGWPPAAAFGGTRLRAVGELLDAVDRWGAPAVPGLRALADDLRADRRAAAEEAAERAQLALVFPTTLLTLPSFALAVVPPLVWTGLAT